MEKKKVQMGSTYLYSGCRKRGRQTSVHHLTPQLPFSPQPSTVGERGSLCWVGMSLTLALPPNFLLFISHLQEQTGQTTVQDKAVPSHPSFSRSGDMDRAKRHLRYHLICHPSPFDRWGN